MPTTQRGYKGQILQHHIMVQVSLNLTQEPPLLLREVHSHVLKGPVALLYPSMSLSSRQTLFRPQQELAQTQT